MNTATIMVGLRAAMRAADLATRALEAANNGDDEAAREYLAQSRSDYEAARQAWDDAEQS